MAKPHQLHLLFALAFILLSAVVQAQWWGGGNSDDEDDEDYSTGAKSTGWGWRPSSSSSQGRGWPSSSQPWNQWQPKSSSQQQPWNQPWQSKPSSQPWNSKPTQQPWNSKQSSQPWNNKPSQQPWNQPWQSKPNNQPNNPWNTQTWPPQQQPTRQPNTPVTVTVTRGQPNRPSSQPTRQPPPVTQQPTSQTIIAQPGPSRTKTWSQPSQWGPSRPPFGPTGSPTGPQTIPTTTTEPYREPVPFLTTCGRTKYVEYDVSNALITGCYYKNKTQTVNNSGFPKLFENRYGFNFGDARPPYYEFPLIDSAAYIGGPTGPDRVIFTEQCFLAGEITQTNAGARQWTECLENY